MTLTLFSKPESASPPEALSATEPEIVPTLAPPVVEDRFIPQLLALLRYMARTEVHTYAFSVAANSILSLFPFIVLLLTLARVLFHSRTMETLVVAMMRSVLPTGQDFVMRNMQLLAHPHKSTQIFSLVMLLITSTGVFLPLEVALNSVWGVKEDRSYLHNQVVSLGLAFAVGIIALSSVAFAAGQQTALDLLLLGNTHGAAFVFASHWFARTLSILAGILLFFLIYWILPNRKVPALAVLPTAIVVGLLWAGAKYLYMLALPLLDFQAIYGPFYISVGLMMWAFLSGLLLLGGAHFSATRHSLRLAREAEQPDDPLSAEEA